MKQALVDRDRYLGREDMSVVRCMIKSNNKRVRLVKLKAVSAVK